MDPLLIVIGAHYIADYPLQGSFLAAMKGKRLYILFVHALIYAFTISAALMYMGKYDDWKFAVVLFTHMIIDKWKSRRQSDDDNWNLLYMDQILHLGVNALMII